MGRKPSNLVGEVFGRLTVITRDENRTNKVYWICKCVCGSEGLSILGADMTRKSRSGTKSCGCLAKELLSARKKKFNDYDLSGDFGVGYTLNGEEFYFDVEDYSKIKPHCWSISEGYVITSMRVDGALREVKMHRFLLNSEVGTITDHIDRVRNNNQKKNLRIVTERENAINITTRKDNTSGRTGVTYNTRDNKWIAQISHKGKQIEILRTESKQEAIGARAKAEEEYYKGIILVPN